MEESGRATESARDRVKNNIIFTSNLVSLIGRASEMFGRSIYFKRSVKNNNRKKNYKQNEISGASAREELKQKKSASKMLNSEENNRNNKPSLQFRKQFYKITN